MRRHPVTGAAGVARPRAAPPPTDARVRRRPPLRVVDGRLPVKAKAKTSPPAPIHVTVLVGAVTILLALGLVMVLSAGSVASLQAYGWSYYYFAWQAPAALVGGLLAWGISRVDYRRWRPLCVPALFLAVGTLFLVLLPGMGHGAYGARRWIGYGIVKVQPSEFAKPILVLFCAHVSARRLKEGAPPAAVLGPPLLALAVTGGLILFEPDLGTTVAITIAVFAVVFAAGASLRSIGSLVFVSSLMALVMALGAGYRRTRLFSFLDPWSDPQSSGYQLVQSLIALGGGGWTGVGLGASRQKWLFLPNAHTDFIFSIIGEELGLIGTLTVVVLFAVVAWAGLRTAVRAPDAFGTLLAAGVTAWLVGQALINMGTATGLLPVTGIPLPFVSFGLSQLAASLAGVGLLVSVGRAGASTGRGASRTSTHADGSRRRPATRSSTRSASRTSTRSR